MPRRRPIPSTALGAAVQARRGERKLRDVAAEVGVTASYLSRIETGAKPARAAGQALARWLGWTLEEVSKAAREPAEVVEVEAPNELAAELIRRRAGRALKDFAAEVGIKPALITRLEKGGRPPDLGILARALGWSEERVQEVFQPDQEKT